MYHKINKHNPIEYVCFVLNITILTVELKIGHLDYILFGYVIVLFNILAYIMSKSQCKSWTNLGVDMKHPPTQSILPEGQDKEVVAILHTHSPFKSGQSCNVLGCPLRVCFEIRKWE